jgi:hypothetical protein
MSTEHNSEHQMDRDSRSLNSSEPLLGSIVSHQEGDQSRKPMSMKHIHCDSQGCGLPATCSVEFHFFCIGHFIAHCYDRLEECAKLPVVCTAEKLGKSVDRFLQECTQQAANLVDPIRGLDNLERARLFDIFLWASELSAKRSVFTKPEIIDAAYRMNRRSG